MKTLNELIAFYSNQFEGKTRYNGENYVIFKDDASDELKGAVQEAHGDRLPNDFIFGTFADLLQSLRNYTIDSIDYLDEIESEVITSYIDIYTHDLTKWLASDINNVYYITQVLEEQEIKDGFELLAAAQYQAIADVWQYVKDFIIEQAEEATN
jgi:hypothetical protein